jgi:hypothetical protein
MMVGNGWRILAGVLTLAGTGEVAMVALLLLLFLYCVILLWNEPSMGEAVGEGNFPRSSADLDHPLREILRRSPRPPEEGDEG